jgi:hypothetical protein
VDRRAGLDREVRVKILLALPEIESRSSGRPVRKPDTILTELPQLPHRSIISRKLVPTSRYKIAHHVRVQRFVPRLNASHATERCSCASLRRSHRLLGSTTSLYPGDPARFTGSCQQADPHTPEPYSRLHQAQSAARTGVTIKQEACIAQ